MENKKIALCLSGKPTSSMFCFAYIYDAFLNNNYNVDVFIHTWWDKNMVGGLYPCAKHAEKSLSEKDRIVKENLIEDLVKLYNPNQTAVFLSIVNSHPVAGMNVVSITVAPSLPKPGP